MRVRNPGSALKKKKKSIANSATIGRARYLSFIALTVVLQTAGSLAI